MKKLETVSPSVGAQPQDKDARVLVLIKLRPGAERPEYLVPRAEIAPGMFSAEVAAGDLERIESDPAVETMSLSRSVPLID
jgi:hypothetical protein